MIMPFGRHLVFTLIHIANLLDGSTVLHRFVVNNTAVFLSEAKMRVDVNDPRHKLPNTERNSSALKFFKKNSYEECNTLQIVLYSMQIC